MGAAQMALFGCAVCLATACAPTAEARAPTREAGAPRDPVETAAGTDVPTTEESMLTLVANPNPGADNPDGELVAEESSVPSNEAPGPYSFQAPLPDASTLSRSPAKRYASLSPSACRAELRKRGLPTKPSSRAAPGVATPVRLTGRLGSVRFITPGDRSVYGIVDCRLVLVLREFADLLAEHRVTAVHVDNFYRPKAHLPGRRSKRSQHAYGLAIDIMAFSLEDGRTLLVERDFHAAVGTSPCGPDSRPLEVTDESIAIHNIVCAAARAGLFHHVLTPHYNEEHRDHVHLDIKRNGGVTVIR